MSWIAGVIVNMPVDNVDRVYDYVVPDDMENNIDIGSRVLISFKNNIIDGFILEKRPTSETSSTLKNIIDSVDDIKYFDKNSVELINYIANKYICRYIDVIKCFIPPEVNINVKKKIVVRDDLDIDALDKEERNLLEKLNAETGVYVDEVRENIKIINRLRAKGFVSFIPDINRGMRHKKIRMVRLKSLDENVVEYMTDKEREFTELLKGRGWVAASELVKSNKTSYDFINRMHRKGFIDYEYLEQRRIVEFPDVTEGNYTLSIPQITAINHFKEAREKGKRDFLLYGVPNSGKTDVYMEIAKDILKENKRVMVLVPDIFLTPQLIARFVSKFGDEVAVFHSMLSDGQHFDEWDRVRRGDVKIVIGTRSAAFLPIKNLGLIVIDEEQDRGFKQSDMYPFYDARDVAKKRCELEGASLLLCSSTPSVETYYKALKGELGLLYIQESVNKFDSLSQVVDLKQELKKGHKGIISRQLITEIERCLKNGEQAMLFLNKRGYAGTVMCQQCGYIFKCPHCEITLNYHSDKKTLTCHYCNYSRHIDQKCPECGANGLIFRGFGTQRIEKEINKLFPEARVLRADGDSMKGVKSINHIYNEFRNGKADILIGTQVIAKGLDFPNVTLAAVIMADIGLNLPDFRSGESTFQLITQLRGRTGRSDKRGKVLIQTFNPEHYCIHYAASNNYAAFYKREIAFRENYQYPPFVFLARILCTGLEDETVRKAIDLWYNNIVNNIKYNGLTEIKLLHPAPCPISKIKDFYRWQIIVKGKDENTLSRLIKDSYNSIDKVQGVRYIMDINPFNML